MSFLMILSREMTEMTLAIMNHDVAAGTETGMPHAASNPQTDPSWEAGVVSRDPTCPIKSNEAMQTSMSLSFYVSNYII